MKIKHRLIVCEHDIYVGIHCEQTLYNTCTYALKEALSNVLQPCNVV